MELTHLEHLISQNDPTNLKCSTTQKHVCIYNLTVSILSAALHM